MMAWLSGFVPYLKLFLKGCICVIFEEKPLHFSSIALYFDRIYAVWACVTTRKWWNDYCYIWGNRAFNISALQNKHLWWSRGCVVKTEVMKLSQGVLPNYPPELWSITGLSVFKSQLNMRLFWLAFDTKSFSRIGLFLTFSFLTVFL